MCVRVRSSHGSDGVVVVHQRARPHKDQLLITLYDDESWLARASQLLCCALLLYMTRESRYMCIHLHICMETWLLIYTTYNQHELLENNNQVERCMSYCWCLGPDRAPRCYSRDAFGQNGVVDHDSMVHVEARRDYSQTYTCLGCLELRNTLLSIEVWYFIRIYKMGFSTSFKVQFVDYYF